MPEFNFDDERLKFEFNPLSEYLHLKDENGNVMMTYQALGKLAEVTSKLLVAWEKRAAAVHLGRQDPYTIRLNDWVLSVVMVNHYNSLNLYQLKMEERNDLLSYSVRKLEMIFGGKEEMMKLREVVDNISNFVRRVMIASVGHSLPCPMSYPVINTILSYLLPVRGAVNIGPVSNDDSKEGEREDMERLYLAMTEVFNHVQEIMFIEPITVDVEASIYHQYITEQIELLVEMFQVLVERVKSMGLQISLEGLDIKDTGTEEEKDSK